MCCWKDRWFTSVGFQITVMFKIRGRRKIDQSRIRKQETWGQKLWGDLKRKRKQKFLGHLIYYNHLKITSVTFAKFLIPLKYIHFFAFQKCFPIFSLITRIILFGSLIDCYDWILTGLICVDFSYPYFSFIPILCQDGLFFLHSLYKT